jgi:hypothetical protein
MNTNLNLSGIDEDNSVNNYIEEEEEEEEEEDVSDEKENMLLGIFLENAARKLKNNIITTKEKTEIYRFILNFNNVKNIESNEYLQNKNILKYYILGWYVSSNLSSSTD